MRFEDKKINEFTEVLASKEAVPGGGGASALVGSIGMALGNMVGSLTTGKKKYADVEEDIQALMTEGENLRIELLSMMDKDAEAFAPLAKAYGIPKDDPSRDEVMEKALDVACQAPMDIMRTVCKALDVIKEFAAKGSALAISDAGVGAVCCKAALQGASLNVFINTKSMKDRTKAEALEAEANAMLDKYCRLADEIYAVVVERIK
ncbi:MAG: cyclodeaminase/cyclohydrolase family protein [Firmicutes bacterium]|nr:cyclodeaminase/cyclohydrolase family protein [Bacillota bacterium]